MTTYSRCLVLGGRGFIGTHLVDALLSQGYFVRCFGRPNPGFIAGARPSRERLEFMAGDFMNASDIEAALEGTDACFHLISTTDPKSSNANPVFDVESNLLGTIRLLEQAVKHGVKKVIFVSSGGTVYGPPLQTPIPESHPTDPICSHGISKLAIEKYLHLFHRLHQLDYVVLRLANPFGERQRIHASQGAIAVFLGKALRGEVIDIWGDGSVIRDYIYIADTISALLAALEFSGTERIFNIGSGIGLSLNDVLDTIETVTRRPTHRRYLESRWFDVPVSVLSIERAARQLGWFPQVSFEDGLARFAQSLQTGA